MSDWRKSTYSSYNTNCAEVGWRRSGFCESSQCAEVGAAEQVLVRDTMDRDGVTLAFAPDVWAAFTASLKELP